MLFNLNSFGDFGLSPLSSALCIFAKEKKAPCSAAKMAAERTNYASDDRQTL